MRVFLDTNVLVSALSTQGLCWELLNIIAAEQELLIDERVLAEFEHIQTGKFGMQATMLESAVKNLRELACVTSGDTTLAEIEVDDPDDGPILAAALAEGAEYFVTGDKMLLGLGNIGEMCSVSPREMWSTLFPVGK